MPIANLNDWTKNINPPVFQNTYSDGHNTLRYMGGSGYERVYYAVTVPQHNSITFSLKFCSPTGFSCDYGDSQEYIVIFGTPPTSDGPMTNFSILARTPVSGSASDVPVEYSVSYANATAADITVYLGIDWGYLVDGVEVQLEYDDIQIEAVFSGWELIGNQLTLANGKLAKPISGDAVEPPYPSTFWQLQNNNILTLNDEYYTYTLAPIVDVSINRDDNVTLTYPYPASFWWYDTTVDRSRNMLLPDELIPSSEGGAFYHAENLEYVKIPRTVTSIGMESFKGTNLKKVCISRNCTYYSSSFPSDCQVIFYEDMYDENYRITVSGKRSYRYTETVTHSEDSVSEENP